MGVMEKKIMIMVVSVSLVMIMTTKMIPCVDAAAADAAAADAAAAAAAAAVKAAVKRPEIYIVGHFFQGWGVDFTDPYDYNGWASQHSFYVGDWLFFGYNPELDNVLVVNETDYKACNLVHPIEKLTSNSTGQVLFNLSSIQTYYFISGGGSLNNFTDYCNNNNMRLQITVLDTQFYNSRDAPPANEEAPAYCISGGRNVVSTVIGTIAVAWTLIWCGVV